MKQILRSRGCALAVALLFTAPVVAVPLYSHDVFCGTDKCGTMEIDIYDVFKERTRQGTPVGGVEIAGQFVPAKNSYFRYLQAVVTDDDPPNWIDGTPIGVPYLDTPPGGYQDDPWDYLAYYDQGEFPDFYDRPQQPLASANNGPYRLYFETWLVCVIQEMLGANPNEARDDSYTVALLLGWEWGFQITKTGPNNDLVDYTVSRLPFAWRAAPSASFIASWGQTYGAGANQDFFNIGRGPCEECLDAPIPEPATYLLAGPVLLILMLRRARRA